MNNFVDVFCNKGMVVCFVVFICLQGVFNNFVGVEVVLENGIQCLGDSL